MSAFYDNSITDLGRLLLADIQMGAAFTPTKIVVGSGYLPSGKTTKTITGVAQPVKDLDINKSNKTPDGNAIFGAVFTNESITEAFYYRELGLYAKGVYKDGKETPEVLYSYGNAGVNAELIPAYSTNTVIERQLDLIVYIGNDAIVNITVETGLYVTIPTFNDAVSRLETSIAEVKTKADTAFDNAQIAKDSAQTANAKAQEAGNLARQAILAAADASDAASLAQQTANSALEKAVSAQTRADLAYNYADANYALISANTAILSNHEVRIKRLEDALFNDIIGNPFNVLFNNLTGVMVTGVWNQALQRMEC